MLIHPWDAGTDEEALAFVRANEFGHLIASGRDRDVPVVVPTQFLLADASTILLHLARPNPIWPAIEENPAVVMAVAGDWAYVEGAWKALPDAGEDPRLGVPTTYYAAVQLVCHAEIVDDPDGKLGILRAQLAHLDHDLADPAEHHRRLPGIRGLRLTVQKINGKFKFGGNVDEAHRRYVAERLAERGGPGDRAARDHLLRRLGREHHP
ncbi:FMN-binding negative transcriptional regulator [Microbispora hainanensis]|uniref:FMN-binding negative transcriptional regulator n=1 Tax=Microbispora hainanensis TaxID=568844 RepID=A0ABZ1T0P2_9ACTN|nr:MULTISPECIES: FMN-binding negative transcriptional regulator [Microbispora]NJP23538.1 FMN-binding negative transcriptional regulator [Microbispora sp. CL1-1]TQS15771.1 FMN-binding negative transcriptional regulator [Microbispora sp. SCL1-1]